MPRARLDRRDLAAMVALMALGLALRLAWASGYGLGDDWIYRLDIANVLSGRIPSNPQNAYRFTWWLPTALSCRVLGLSERGLILPITTFAVLGLGVVYALGKALFGRAGAWMAALLLVVHPLDVAWSTMLAGDVIVSFFSGLCVLGLLRALEDAPSRAKRRWWAVAAAALWLAYHAKLSALMLVPALVAALVLERRRLDRQCLVFPAAAVLLFGGSIVWCWIFDHDPLAAYHGELTAQGLSGANAAAGHRVELGPFLGIYPGWLFLPDMLGDLLNSVYPHLVVLLALASPWLGLRTSLVAACWFASVFFGLEFNLQRADGVWIAGFRNIRHAHVFVYPLVLLLAGYLAGLRARWRRAGDALLVALLAFSAWQSVATASKTSVAFGDLRRAATFLAGLPRKPVYSDFQVRNWLPVLDVTPPLEGHELAYNDMAKRRLELADIRSGYLVTGGAREPYWGCIACIPSMSELEPGQWRLLAEFPGPPPRPWRPEPLRVWEAVDTGPVDGTQEGNDAGGESG
ncbi:MAG: glycosyltransferase family 39 protein [Deltaproteobacteria bacterium]|nr:MAG: glycosyltransferase family 39 protein [Deltaproteobacteria bacterium]